MHIGKFVAELLGFLVMAGHADCDKDGDFPIWEKKVG
jgi:hypothetical protein